MAFPLFLCQLSQLIFSYSANKDKTTFPAQQAVMCIQMKTSLT